VVRSSAASDVYKRQTSYFSSSEEEKRFKEKIKSFVGLSEEDLFVLFVNIL
jgi:hypothetical protein